MDSIETFLNKLNAAAATTGKKEKQAIVKTFTPVEQDLVRRALDPTINYYVAKLEMPEKHGACELTNGDLELLDALASREVTGNEALQQISRHMHGLDRASQEVLRRVILKDLRCGVGVTMVNSVFPGLVPDFAYMRCSLPKAVKLDTWPWEDGVFAQLKADGSFARVAVPKDDGDVLITTRQGNTYPKEAMAKLCDDAKWVFAAGTETHGELTIWIDGELQPRTIGNGMLNGLMNGTPLPTGAEVRFDAWDQIPLAAAVPKGRYEVPYVTRYGLLAKQLAEGGRSSIMLIEGKIVTSYDAALEYYRSILARGLEGVIVKHPNMVWFDGDSKEQVKLKLEVDVDLEIVGFNPGEPGKRTELTFGSVQCQTIDGELEVAVSGFKREMEQFLHENRDSVLGKVMCVRANAVSPPCENNPKYSLFHPRVVELRDDKYEADTLQQVIDQFEAAVA